MLFCKDILIWVLFFFLTQFWVLHERRQSAGSGLSVPRQVDKWCNKSINTGLNEWVEIWGNKYGTMGGWPSSFMPGLSPLRETWARLTCWWSGTPPKITIREGVFTAADLPMPWGLSHLSTKSLFKTLLSLFLSWFQCNPGKDLTVVLQTMHWVRAWADPLI